MAMNYRLRLFHKTHEPHECDSVDVTDVETRLVRSRLFRRFSKTSDVIARVSRRDGRFDGSYCARANAKIVEKNLWQNVRTFCVEPLCESQCARFCKILVSVGASRRPQVPPRPGHAPARRPSRHGPREGPLPRRHGDAWGKARNVAYFTLAAMGV